MENNSRSGGKFKKICVFCGSNPGHRKVFSDAAIDLGNELVNRRIDLVYGGGSVGLMGLLSQRVYDGGCHVLGVIPKALVPIEISGETVGEVKIVSDMHERKAEMAREAEAFIALPGKDVGLLNVDGYYDSLLTLFDKGVEEGFIKPSARHIVLSAPTAEELLTKMELGPFYDDALLCALLILCDSSPRIIILSVFAYDYIAIRAINQCAVLQSYYQFTLWML
ncbi:hypothetical protein DH2020_047886 [Rehmannia glutinosa]|uniref:Cytokinin riboside 5'-monophosphate phosphoribohydrolase n=1 Tax=Rehmannia glutinosa TaxID=99300 RepID=A0ABR0U847_REHGL